jgi:hypothetical protein
MATLAAWSERPKALVQEIEADLSEFFALLVGEGFDVELKRERVAVADDDSDNFLRAVVLVPMPFCVAFFADGFRDAFDESAAVFWDRYSH